jgi:hypothetical protein
MGTVCIVAILNSAETNSPDGITTLLVTIEILCGSNEIEKTGKVLPDNNSTF